MAEHTSQRKYHLFIDGTKYETDLATMTGAEIKALIPNFDPQYSLYLEGHGSEPDKLIADNESVSLETGPKRFHTVPPASFGK